MTQLVDEISTTANVHLSATEHDDRIIFLHNVLEGAASQSYGLQVAKLAGVPDQVIRNAKTQLAKLEENEHQVSQGATTGSMVTSLDTPASSPGTTPNTTAPRPSSEKAYQNDFFSQEPSEFELEFKKLSLDEMTPKQALDALYALNELISVD